MENYDRQQYDGDFGEVREDTFVAPSDGEAVPEDAGSGNWGGSPNWDTPQEEQQQEQGFVEGGYDTGSEYDTGSDYDTGSEYDPGFVPEGEYTPGSEYDPGFIPQSGADPSSEYEGGYDPVFTWGGFEDDFMAEEPADAPAADSSGGTPPLETDGQADATGDPEIEMYSNDTGQASYDDGQEPNDAPDPSGGTPPPEDGEQADADSGDEQIEMPPEYVGQTGANDAGNGEIEMPPMYVGRDADAGDGEVETPPEDGGPADAGGDEIEMPPMYVGRTGLDAAHEEELAQYGTHEELAGLYRSLNENLYERYPDLVEGMNKQLESREDLDTHEELKAATKGLLEQWYLRDAHHQRLEGSYADELADGGFGSHPDANDNYRELADYYKTLSMALSDSDQEPGLTGMETYEKLKTGVYELLEQRDQYLQQRERDRPLEEKDESRTDDSDETPVIDSGKDSPEIEMPPKYVGQTGADAGDGVIEIPPTILKGTGANAGDPKIEMYSDEVGQAGAADGEIEMPPDNAGQAGADAAVDENDIEIHDGAGQASADNGVNENDIEIHDDAGGVKMGYPRVTTQDEAHEKELAEFDRSPSFWNDYEGLATKYKEIASGLPDNYRIPGNLDAINKMDLKSAENLDTYEELKAATKVLLERRDKQAEYEQQLEGRYGDELSRDPGLQTYDQLADYYKDLSMLVYDLDQGPLMDGLNTYEKLKTAVYELWNTRDNYLRGRESVLPLKEKDESHTDDSVEPSVIDSDQAALDGYYRDVGHDEAVDHVDDPAVDLWG